MRCRAGSAALALTLLLGFGVLACGRAPAPVDRHFRLGVSDPAQRLARPGIAGTLIVDRPHGDALLAQRPIVFRPHADSPELGQYAYALWVDVPTTMLQHAIAAHLQAAGVASQVFTSDLAATGEFLLRARLVRFEHVRGRSPGVEVELELVLAQRESGAHALSGRYAASRSLESDTIPAVVTALRSAVGEVLDVFVADVAARGVGNGLLPVPAQRAVGSH